MRKYLRFCSSLVLVALASAGASFGSVIFNATDGLRAAQAEFETSGTNLIIRLANTATADVQNPTEILTALFFDVSGSSLSLTPASAVLGGTSVVHFDSQPAGGVVGGEWAYLGGLSNAPHGADYGISSAGFGIFGQANFPGPNLDGPTAVNGMQYGITSQGDNLANGNAAVTGQFPLIQYEVVFTLSGLPANFDLNRIGNVNFQYGTSLTEPNIPEPASLLLLALGGVLLRRR